MEAVDEWIARQKLAHTANVLWEVIKFSVSREVVVWTESKLVLGPPVSPV